MVICGNCGEKVKPNIYFRWSDFIWGIGIFYLIYIISKIPHCPNCNFPMPRRTMVFAIHPPQYFIKFTGMIVTQLISLKVSASSASRRSYQRLRFDLSQYIAGMKIPQIPLNVMINEVQDSIGSRIRSSKSNLRSCDLYDKGTTKIFDQLGSHLIVCEKDERS